MITPTRYQYRCPNSLLRQKQVLTYPRLDDKLRLRGIRLIRKISKAQKILPSSYILQGHVNIESVYFFGGSADVSKGEYQGRTVAVKCLRTSEGDSNSIFKVSFINLANLRITVAQLSPRGCVERSYLGKTYPTQTFCPFLEFLFHRTRIPSAFSLSGCQTEMLCSTQDPIPRQIVYTWRVRLLSLHILLLFIKNS